MKTPSPRRFAAGGPTGFELPRRFIDAAAGLLSPGGRAFIACLDIEFDDGKRFSLRHYADLMISQSDNTAADHLIHRLGRDAVEAQLETIMQQGQQLEAQQQKLVEGEKTLAAKIEAFRSQKEVIKAQYSAAEAQVRIGEAATGIGEQMADVGLAVQRAKDKTEQMQARASAIDELTTSGSLQDLTSSGDDIDRQLAEISQGSQVDDQLAKMKAELGKGEDPPKEIEGEKA